MKMDLNIGNINYIKIVYKDKNDFTHCIKAAIKRINEHEILASTKYEEQIIISTPQEVKLSIACENGLYKADTILQRTEKAQPYILFYLKTPDSIDYQQNREYFRVKINESALITYDINENSIQSIPCETFDLSANGVRLAIEEHIDFPEVVHITLYLPQRTIEADAKYIRTDEEDKILKASFSFLNLQENDLDCISQMCFKKQLELRRKSLM